MVFVAQNPKPLMQSKGQNKGNRKSVQVEQWQQKQLTNVEKTKIENITKY